MNLDCIVGTMGRGMGLRTLSDRTEETLGRMVTLGRVVVGDRTEWTVGTVRTVGRGLRTLSDRTEETLGRMVVRETR